MHDYRKLKVWESAKDEAVAIYELTRQLPTEERYGLQLQMHRAATSIASNIAEGAGRSSAREFRRFLTIAAGSASELETQLIIAVEAMMLAERDVRPHLVRLDRIRRMLEGLRRSLASN